MFLNRKSVSKAVDNDIYEQPLQLNMKPSYLLWGLENVGLWVSSETFFSDALIFR